MLCFRGSQVNCYTMEPLCLVGLPALVSFRCLLFVISPNTFLPAANKQTTALSLDTWLRCGDSLCLSGRILSGTVAPCQQKEWPRNVKGRRYLCLGRIISSTRHSACSHCLLACSCQCQCGSLEISFSKVPYTASLVNLEVFYTNNTHFCLTSIHDFADPSRLTAYS